MKKIMFIILFIIINFGCTNDHNHNKANNTVSGDLCKSYDIINNVFSMNNGKIYKVKTNLVQTMYHIVALLEDDKNCYSLRYIIESYYFKNIIPDELKKMLNRTDTELIVVYKKYKKDIKKYLKKWLKEAVKKEYILLYPIDLENNYNNHKEIFYDDLGYESLFHGPNNPTCGIRDEYNKWIDYSKVVPIGVADLPIIYLENLKRFDDSVYFYIDRISPEIAIKVRKNSDKGVLSFMALVIKFKKFKKATICVGIRKVLLPIYVGRIIKVGIINVRENNDSKTTCEVIWEEDYS